VAGDSEELARDRSGAPVFGHAEVIPVPGVADVYPLGRDLGGEELVEALGGSWSGQGAKRGTDDDILREFEAKGYITLEPDPEDRRAKRIVLTDRGWAFGKTVEQLSRAISRRWAAEVGDERYAIFEDVLKEMAIKARAHRDPQTNSSPAEPPARPVHKAPEAPAT
jgi:hypothetical protein